MRIFFLMALLAQPAQAFCGFFVSGADQKLYNNASHVVLMRKGNHVVMTMSNSYKGPPADRIRRIEVDASGKRSIDTFFEGSKFTMGVGAHSNGWLYVATRNEIFRIRAASSSLCPPTPPWLPMVRASLRQAAKIAPAGAIDEPTMSQTVPMTSIAVIEGEAVCGSARRGSTPAGRLEAPAETDRGRGIERLRGA